MSFLICVAALVFLMFVAYRGFSVILFAPIAALLARCSSLSLRGGAADRSPACLWIRWSGFVKLYFPVFLLGAVFGKVIELSGFSKSIVSVGDPDWSGANASMLSIVLVCAVLTYGGVSLFVVVFAVYPFAAEMFRLGKIRKRLIPGTDCARRIHVSPWTRCPGTPQIQNIIPTPFFKTDAWAAPWLGVIGAVFIFTCGMAVSRMAPPRRARRRRRLWHRPHQRAGRAPAGTACQPVDRDPAPGRGGRLQQGLHRGDSGVLRRHQRGAACRHGSSDRDLGGRDRRHLGRPRGAADGHPHRLRLRIPQAVAEKFAEGSKGLLSRARCSRRRTLPRSTATAR